MPGNISYAIGSVGQAAVSQANGMNSLDEDLNQRIERILKNVRSIIGYILEALSLYVTTSGINIPRGRGKAMSNMPMDASDGTRRRIEIKDHAIPRRGSHVPSNPIPCFDGPTPWLRQSQSPHM